MPLGTNGAGTGRLGLDSLGECPLGGTGWTPFVLPIAQPGSDRLDAAEHKLYGERVHERDGLIVGVLSRGQRRKWKQVWQAISRTDAEALIAFADRRRFYLLPTGDPAGGKIVVYWQGAEVAAQTLRAGYRSLEAEFVELAGPAAAAP